MGPLAVRRSLKAFVAKASTFMDPPFLTFSAEILIEILAYLPLRDIVACQSTCRKLHDIIANSSLLQYIIQSFLAGVHDPLLPGASIVERSNALQELEITWRNLDIRHRTAQIPGVTAWPWLNYTVHDDYLLAVRGDSLDSSQSSGYSYVDLRQPSALIDPLWRNIDVPWHGQRCVFAFAADENDLAVVVTCARDEEDISRAEVHCLSFVSGEAHPQAENPDLVVDFPGPSSPHNIQVQITGGHIFLSCNGSPNDEHQVDVLFLVSWKEGTVTSLRETPPPAMTFAVGFTRISEKLLAFVHMVENAIFLYDVVEEPGRIKFIRALELPPLCDGGRLHFAHCPLEQNPIFHHHAPRTTNGSRLPPRFPFRYNPADGIACFVLGVGLEEIPGASMTIAIVVHHSALVALASAGAAAAGAGAGDGAGDGGAPANVQPVPVPWDSWGPPVTRCLEVPYWRRCRGPVGQRWGVLAHDRLVMHDFNPHSVRRAVAQLSHATHAGAAAAAAVAAPPPGPGPGSSAGAAGMLLLRLHSENGNRTRVVTAPTRLTAGLCFRGDVMSHLPYVETRAMCAPRRWESVLTDGERLFGLYFKDDDADAHKVDIDVYVMGTAA